MGKATQIPASVRKLLAVRSGGMCEVCHTKRATDAHHRQYRSRGGPDTIENLLHLCGPGNAGGCHRDAHGKSPRDGTAISAWDKRPHHVIPFTDRFGYTWRLRTDGTKEKIR